MTVLFVSNLSKLCLLVVVTACPGGGRTDLGLSAGGSAGVRVASAAVQGVELPGGMLATAGCGLVRGEMESSPDICGRQPFPLTQLAAGFLLGNYGRHPAVLMHFRLTDIYTIDIQI